MIKKIAIISILIILTGCSEVERLKSENQMLKNKIVSLESDNQELKQEILKLKETADYHYKRGVDFITANNFEKATIEFRIVLDKYSTSPLVAPAKKQLKKANAALAKLEAVRIAEVNRRKEEEKNRPRTANEADTEWLKFRNNEKSFKGTVTTWRMRYMSEREDFVFSYKYCLLNDNLRRPVRVRDVVLGKFFKENISENDWVIVTGKFRYVTSRGEIELDPIKVKRIGYID